MQPQEKYEICVQALKEYVENAGFSDVVIGISGGIDSSVCATMCVDAFGSKHVHGVMLPGPHSSDHSIADARLLAQNLSIPYEIVSIKKAYQAFDETLEHVCGGALEGLAAENTQARCRMVCLMALSNKWNWLMVNTGNKSEAMTGYSTLYGDTAGAFAPIGGFYKTDVFALANWRNEYAIEKGQTPPIPQSSITKPPSAELSPDQQDERALGMSYSQLDDILISYVEHGKSAQEIASRGHALSQVEHVLARMEAFTFKRAMEPPYPETKFY